jgi:hypothetical protein
VAFDQGQRRFQAQGDRPDLQQDSGHHEPVRDEAWPPGGRVMIASFFYFGALVIMTWVLVLNFVKIGEYGAQGKKQERAAMVVSTLINIYMIATLVIVYHRVGS